MAGRATSRTGGAMTSAGPIRIVLLATSVVVGPVDGVFAEGPPHDSDRDSVYLYSFFREPNELQPEGRHLVGRTFPMQGDAVVEVEPLGRADASRSAGDQADSPAKLHVPPPVDTDGLAPGCGRALILA